jgi:sugar phosphate isomerase/epimerase
MRDTEKAVIGGRAYSLELIRAIGALGFPFAEISLDDPEKIERQMDLLISARAECDLYYIAHYPNEDNPFDAQILRERFLPRIRRLLELSERLEIHKGTLHFWLDRRRVSSELAERKIGLLLEMVAYATQCGVTLCLENLSERHDNFSPAFEAIPELRMTLDIGHGQLLSRENRAYGFIEHHFDRIDHLHVHDNRGGTSPRDDLHLPLGEGIIDYPHILGLLRDKGYHSTITMEIKPPDMLRTRDLIRQFLT